MIVDEEQRFGVEHKEYLKSMRTAVDVLSMSATPIPRTLEMSLTGIREMSTILTPPEERHPVLTYVGAWEDKQMAAAIRRELLRDGQVFVIHNRVQSIDKAAAKIRNLVPEARVAVGHGQMKEHELERIMVGFWEKEYDVLVATTIVESGLDIPNANTLIVDRADTFGLSQLHQIRGRVGRGRERAYAYFTYDPPAAADRDLGRPADHHRAQHRPRRRHGRGDEGPGDPRLGQPARRRAVRAHRRRRLRPLRPAGRGGGDRRRADQRRGRAGRAAGGPGRPARRRAPAARLRAGRAAAHGGLPEGRLGAGPTTQAQAVLDELTDRYGAPPAPVLNLLAVARFRHRDAGAGHHRGVAAGPAIRISPLPLPESKQMRLARLCPGSVWKSAVGTISVPRAGAGRGQPLRDVALLDWARGCWSACSASRTAVAGLSPCTRRAGAR